MLSPQPYIEIAWMSHGALAATYVGRAEIVRWLSDFRVLLEIRVTNVSFLIEMALQTCKTKI